MKVPTRAANEDTSGDAQVTELVIYLRGLFR